jgi:hypothetical protein
MRDDIDDRRDDPFFTPGVIAAMVMAVVLAAALFTWAPWTNSHSRVAGNSALGVTTGQSSTMARPAPATSPAPASNK